MSKKRVLIIGSGLRVRNAILPALWCLRAELEIAGIYSRSEKEISLFDGQFQMTTKNSLEKVDFKSIDLIMLAITISEVPNVLKILSKHNTKHIVLMLDTPVLLPKDILAIRYFQNFRKVLVSEDMIAFPPFVLARQLICEGKIGKLKNIWFFYNGYKYHALASLKMLTGSRIVRLRSRRFTNNLMQKDAHFIGSVRATIYEPRDYDKGKFLLEGTSGYIADYDYPGKSLYRIGYNIENGDFHGLTLNRYAVDKNQADKIYFANIPRNLFEKSLINSMKIRGLMDLITSAVSKNPVYQYRPIDGIWDNATIKISEKLSRFF